MEEGSGFWLIFIYLSLFWESGRDYLGGFMEGWWCGEGAVVYDVFLVVLVLVLLLLHSPFPIPSLLSFFSFQVQWTGVDGRGRL